LTYRAWHGRTMPNATITASISLFIVIPIV